MDALKTYLGVLWRESMSRMTETPARYGEADFAAYDRRLSSRPHLEYSSVTNRWEMKHPPARLYLAARDGIVLPHPHGEAA
jgi:hypothetical protein